MGFPLVSYCIAAPKPLILLFKSLDFTRHLVLLFFSHLGLYRFPRPDQALYRIQIFLPDPLGPSEIKDRLRVVELAALAWSSPGGRYVDEPMCVFCMEGVGARDEVRELGNCDHVFHRRCIDGWIDVGQAMCPVCRSPLLGDEEGKWDLGCGVIDNFMARIW